MHAEAVLLIDDRQRQVLEHHAFLHQRVRADHHLRLARGDLGQHLGARLAGDLAGQPCGAHAQRGQPGAKIVHVLLGQQFGRRGQRDLLAPLHRQHRRQGGDHGLARADIALHQPQHRMRLGQVLADLLEHALLRTGQLERQAVAQLGHQRALPAQRRRVMGLQRHALTPQAEVMCQQFFHRQPTLRRMPPRGQRRQIRIRRWPVHRQQRTAQRGQAQPGQPAGRQQFQRGFFRQPVQRQPDEPAHRRRPDPFDRRIDRVEAVTELVIVMAAHHPVAGVDDLHPEMTGLGGAVAADARAHGELRDLLGAEVEEPQHQRAVGVIFDGDLEHRPTTETALDRTHPPFHLCRHARLQPGDGGQPGPIFIAQRQVQPQILQRGQATGSQLGRHRRPDPGEHRQRCLPGRGQRRCRSP